MPIDNSLDNIFTDFDESIFSDGSIDPMGLRIIWTSLGSKIFHNKLNTVSTDIKFYTLNLFHHYLLQKCIIEEEDSINRLIRRKPNTNKSDLYDGLIIFLENLLINVASINRDKAIVVPGINKLNTIKSTSGNKSRIEKLTVNRDSGILIRQHLLGIHGRHKGPFHQMDIFNKNSEDIYNRPVWNDAAEIFNCSPWKEAELELSDLIKNKILKSNIKSGAYIEYKVEEVLTPVLNQTYVALLRKDIYFDEKIKSFWITKLGLNQDTAGTIYKTFLQEMPNEINFQNILVKANLENSDYYLAAINAIEPFLTLIEKNIGRILGKNTSMIDQDLINFVTNWLDNNDVNTEEIMRFMTIKFINQESINRLESLMKIYINAITSSKPAEKFIVNLIKYHQQIMTSRGNLNWVSIGNDNKIVIHKHIYKSDKDFEHLSTKNWVNSYYLPTVVSLHKGLTNENS